MRAAFYTLGCKLNQSESEALAAAFTGRGLFIVPPSEKADIYLFNTCTVTSMAEQKARRIIRKTAREHPEAVLLVTGCYAQLEPEEAAGLADKVVVVGQQEKDILLDLPGCLAERFGGTEGTARALCADDVRRCIAKFFSSDESAGVRSPFRFDAVLQEFHSRAFLKIQDGCDRSCAYCRVPLARGRSVSLPGGEIIARALRLERADYREIVLTGVNISDYRDPEIDGLPRLIQKLTDALKSARVRLSSLEPEMVTKRFLEAAAHPSVCPHFHLSVQSGSDSVLASVGRTYGRERVLRAAEMLREVKDDPFIAADIITGLPGESEEDFEATRRLVESGDFSSLHVFPYSPRPGTRLYRDHGKPVPERTAGERAKVLQELSRCGYENYLKRWEGRVVKVILDRRSEGGAWSGVAENYLHLLVNGIPKSRARRAELFEARIDGIEPEMPTAVFL
jgi:threonylcarbamoyladenosine tRNA methylthiotransferase MtaB